MAIIMLEKIHKSKDGDPLKKLAQGPCLPQDETALCTVKLVYNDHPLDPKFAAVVDKWSLFRDISTLWVVKLGLQNSVRCRQLVAIRRWSLAQVWLYAEIIEDGPLLRPQNC